MTDPERAFDLVLLMLALVPWIWAAKPWRKLPPKEAR